MAFVAKAVTLAKNMAVQAKPHLQVMKRYAVVEMAPPKLSELGAVRSGFANLIRSAKTGGFRDLTVREAWINSLVAVEVVCWFFVGECIGKRHLVGYDV